MTHVLCCKCRLVMVPDPNRLCVDCWLKTPQERQDRFERMENTIESLRISLRDQLAMAALPAVIAQGKRTPCAVSAAEAYAWADWMLEARKPPLPESG